jgi:Flp pilus assembly protein TadG
MPIVMRNRLGARNGFSARRLLKNEAGAAMVEFAIAAGVFVTMLLGILEFGFAAWEKNSVASDAREGARYAVVHGLKSGRITNATGVSNYVKSKTSLGASNITVTTTWFPTDERPGSTVTVTVSHLVPRRGPFLPQHTVTSTSKMIVVF